MKTFFKSFKPCFKTKKELAKLNEQYNFLSNLIISLPGHVYWKDLNGKIIGCNEEQAKFAGLTRDKIIGKTDYEMPWKSEADILRKIDLEVIKTGKPIETDEPSLVSSGELRLFHSKKVPLRDINGKIIGVLGISFDVTEQREEENKAKKEKFEAERTLKELMSMIPAHIFWYNKDGILLGCNNVQAKAFGYKNAEEMIGTSVYNQKSQEKEDLEILRQVNEKIIETGEPQTAEEPFKYSNGREAIFLSKKAPLRDQKGEITGILGVALDITDQKEKERLEVENEVHKQLLKEQEHFTKIANQVAHDIRSPVASLLMLVKACQEIPEKERVALREAAMTVGDIANNLLNKYQKPDSDIKAEKRQNILTSALLLQLLTDKKYQYQERSIKFDHHFSQTGNFAFIKIEPTALKRTISNLVNNAVDALNKEQGTVNLKLDATNEWVKITVEDNGKGMPQELIEKILKNIAITHNKEDGHGLGLTQVRETLAHNQGELSIESKFGKGTAITLTFPRIKTPLWIATEIKLAPEDMVILLDDDKSIHTAWNIHFEKTLGKTPNITLKHFETGTDTLDFIKKLSLSEQEKIFLLSDYELLKQDLNGLQVIEQSKLKRSILVTSHYANEEIQHQAERIGTKILPKQLASEVPIFIDATIKNQESNTSKKVDLILVDDDQNFADVLINTAFENLKVDHYTTPENFLKNTSKYPKNIKICLDKNFSSGQMNGIALAEILHLQGFTHLYLISGETFKPRSLPDYLTVIDKTEVEKIKNL